MVEMKNISVCNIPHQNLTVAKLHDHQPGMLHSSDCIRFHQDQLRPIDLLT